MHAEAARAISEGNRLRGAGHLDAALAQYRRAAELDPDNANARYNLGIALRQAGELGAAAIEFRAAARIDPRDMDAVQNVVETLALAAERGARPFGPMPPIAAPSAGAPMSIVVCSIDAGRLARMQASFRAALAAREHEFIVIRDARSLAQGYARGLAAARHPIVLFAHDDVELASDGAIDAIESALELHDIVGVAGSQRVTGPAVTWAGHPHLFGGVAYPQDEGARWKATVYGLDTGIIGGMQALDGLLFAARRDRAREVGFDAQTFDGFHFYDLDFVYRAHRAGLRVAVTTRVLALHASEGRFDERWKHYAARFQAKFPHLAQPAGPAFYFGRVFTALDHVVRFHEAWNALGAQP